MINIAGNILANGITFLSTFIFLSLSAQSAIVQGYIMDTEGVALPGAIISVDNQIDNDLKKITLGDVTDSVGYYSISEIPKGKYSITISMTGYRSWDSSFTINSSQEIYISIRLRQLSTNANEITVTGTMLPTTIKESPVKTESVSTEAMENYLPGTTNMVETLKMVNGITEQVGCGVCFTNSISINGLPGPYTAVLLDGAPVFGNLATVYGLNGVPNVAVDRYEVIKGPNSTLYGSEALAGVINIITKNPEKSEYLADAMLSTNSEAFGNISISESIGKMSGIVSGNFGYIGNIEDNNSDGFNDMLNLERITGFTKWTLPINRIDFSLGGNIYTEARRNGITRYLTEYSDELRGDPDIYGESIETERYTLFGSIDGIDQGIGKLDFSMSLYSQDSYYGEDYYLASQDMYWLNYIYPIATESHQILLGSTARFQTYNDNTVATQSIEGNDQPDAQFIPGLFIQDEWDINDDMKLLSGLRLDHYKRHGPIFSPRLSYKWSPSYMFDFRLNTGTGFRIVNLFTEDHAFITGQRQIVIEEELMPEQSYNILAGGVYYYDLGIGWGSGSVDLDGFYTYFQNKIIPNYETDGFITYSNTDGYSYTRGAAFSINHSFDFPLQLTFGMTFLESAEVIVDEGQTSTQSLPYAPSYSGVAMLNYYWEWAEIKVGYSARFTGPQDLPEVFDVNKDTGIPESSPRPTISEAFAIHGLQLTKEFENWDLYVGAQNIGDFMQSYSPIAGYNDPNSNPGFSQYFDTAYAYSPIHGREVYIGIRAKY